MFEAVGPDCSDLVRRCSWLVGDVCLRRPFEWGREEGPGLSRPLPPLSSDVLRLRLPIDLVTPPSPSSSDSHRFLTSSFL
jgi:hypothetical protein